MKILVLNCRIYSLEFELINMPKEEVIVRGHVDKIGLDVASIGFEYENGLKKQMVIEPILNHARALEKIVQILTDKDYKIIKDISEISAVGHRVVHGGEKFFKSVLIDEDVRKQIHKNIELAPLHNPYNLKGIDAVDRFIPKVEQVACFDTSFYQTIPNYAYMYALPLRVYQQYNIRRYGFHGISHYYAVVNTASEIGVSIDKLNMISCYIGPGSSVTAIKHGVPIDTSMGFSPLEGVIMSTRCGDIDPEIVLFLMKTGWTLNEVESMLNRESGLLGVSGVSDDIVDIIEKMNKGDERAKLAVDMFIYRIQKYIGAYYGILGGINALVFTGEIAETIPYIRKRVCEIFGFIGIKIDDGKNNKLIGSKGIISENSGNIKILVIPKNEKLLIARETMNILKTKNIH